MRPLSSCSDAMTRASTRIGLAAPPPNTPECRSRSAQVMVTSSYSSPRSEVVIDGVVWSHMPVSQTSARSRLNSAAFARTKSNRLFEPHSSSPSIIMVMSSGSLPVTALKARQASTKVISWPLSSQAPRPWMILRPSGRLVDLRLERRRAPEIDRIDRLHVVVAVEQHARPAVRRGRAVALGGDHRMPGGRAHRRLEAEALEVLREVIGGRAAEILVGAVGRDRRDAHQIEQPVQGFGRDPRRCVRARREGLRQRSSSAPRQRRTALPAKFRPKVTSPLSPDVTRANPAAQPSPAQNTAQCSAHDRPADRACPSSRRSTCRCSRQSARRRGWSPSG